MLLFHFEALTHDRVVPGHELSDVIDFELGLVREGRVAQVAEESSYSCKKSVRQEAPIVQVKTG